MMPGSDGDQQLVAATGCLRDRLAWGRTAVFPPAGARAGLAPRTCVGGHRGIPTLRLLGDGCRQSGDAFGCSGPSVASASLLHPVLLGGPVWQGVAPAAAPWANPWWLAGRREVRRLVSRDACELRTGLLAATASAAVAGAGTAVSAAFLATSGPRGLMVVVAASVAAAGPGGGRDVVATQCRWLHLLARP